MSDEYGPYIYLFSKKGKVLQAIVPPAAIIPKKNGQTNFTADSNPTTGRSPNQGTSQKFLRPTYIDGLGLCVCRI
jgi:hypothetical protein